MHLGQSWQYNFTELVGSASKKLGQAITLFNKRTPRNEDQSQHHSNPATPTNHRNQEKSDTESSTSRHNNNRSGFPAHWPRACCQKSHLTGLCCFRRAWPSHNAIH